MERIEHWIEPEQRGSERPVFRERTLAGIDRSFSKAAMLRSGSPICATTLARISIELRCESALYPTMSVNKIAASLRCSVSALIAAAGSA